MKSYDELMDTINTQTFFLLYTTSPNCSVCHADYPRVKAIADAAGVMSYTVDVSQVPLITGQLNLFSSPTVMLYYEGKEIHRQARIIDFEELAYRIAQVNDN